jgi:hypothetical protein
MTPPLHPIKTGRVSTVVVASIGNRRTFAFELYIFLLHEHGTGPWIDGLMYPVFAIAGRLWRRKAAD